MHDEAGVFTRDDVEALTLAAQDWPFKVEVLTAQALSKSTFETRLKQSFDLPDTVSIGLDPQQRITAVHFGKGVVVPSRHWASISAAGNSAFREGRYPDGIVAIVDATASARQTVGVSSPEPLPASDWWMIGGFSVAGLALCLGVFVWWRNRKTKQEQEREIAELNAEIAEKKASIPPARGLVGMAAPPPDGSDIALGFALGRVDTSAIQSQLSHLVDGSKGASSSWDDGDKGGGGSTSSW